MTVSEETRAQIEALYIDDSRPIIVSDADEVICHFAEPLESYLKNHGAYIDFKDYRLEGNIKRAADHSPLALSDLIPLINDFFASEVHRQPLVQGAVPALNELGERAQVVVLTNLPHEFRERRQWTFRENGLLAPIVTNTGLKGAAMRLLAERTRAPLVFIDDTPPHLKSVAEALPESYRVHFIADRRLARTLGPSVHSHHRSDCWNTTKAAIADFLASHGF